MQTRNWTFSAGTWIGLLSTAVGLVIQPLQAATKYWDINGATTGAGGATPGGAWTGSLWSTDPLGEIATTTFASGDGAVFSAGTDATGAFAVSGSATASSILVEEGTVSISGTITLSAGTLTIGSGATFSIPNSLNLSQTAGSVITLNAGTMRNTNLGANGSFCDGDATITLNGGGTISYTTAATLSIINATTVISGTGPLTKAGAGIIGLASACTYSGSTIINDGTLRIRTSSNRLPITTDVVINSPGVFDPGSTSGNEQQVNTVNGNGAITYSANSVLRIAGSADSTLSGIVSDGSAFGRIAKQGSGTLTLSGVNTYDGSFTNTAGTTTVTSTGSLIGPAGDVVVNGGVLNLNNAAQTVLSLSGSGGQINLAAGHILTINPSSGNRTNYGTISGDGGINKTGAGLTALAGNNDYLGITTVGAGRLQVSSPNALGSTVGYTEVASGAEILFSGSGINFTCPENFQLAGAGPDNGAIAVQNNANVVLSGTITLVGDTTNTVSGAGTVLYNNPNAITSLANQNLTLQGGALSTGLGGTISGTIALGAGGLTKQQGGTWHLSGVNTYTGPTAVNAGRLNVNSPGSLASGSTVTVALGATLGGTGTIGGPTTVNGTLAPGTSIGTLTFGSSLVLSGTNSMEINKAVGPVLTADKIVMTSGTVTLGGNLTVTNTGIALAVGDTFDLIDGTIAGAFATFNLPALAPGLAWDTSKLAAGEDGTITVVCDASLTAGVVVDQNVTCNGANNGKATVTFSGNGGPFEVRLDAGTFSSQTSPYQFTGLTPGSHTVTVKDANGCTLTTGSFNITQPTVLAASAGGNQVVCNGSSTAIGGSPTASGGTPGYTYLWDNAGTLSSATDPNPMATPTGPTTYTVTVTDANGCVATSSVTLTLQATAGAGGNQTICIGSSTAGLGGTVGGTATGGFWASSGTGTFSPNTNTLNATYLPSGADIANGSVILTLTTTGQDPCDPATAQVIVSITACEPDLQACWRGQGGSTFQAWTFASSNNPAALLPDLLTNSYGAAGSLSFGLFSDGYISSDAFLGSQQGIWDLGRSGTMTLEITNTASSSAGSHKYVNVVLTQFRDAIYNENASVSVPGATLLNQVQQSVGTNSFGGQWISSRTIWRLGSPCPTEESVVITSGTNGTLLDQVLVETMCVDLTCPSDLVLSTDPGQCEKTNVTWTVPALDGCLVTNVVCTPALGSTLPKGNNVIAMQVTDRYGASQTCNFNVLIEDNEAPTVVCPADIVALLTPGQCGAIVTFTPTALDNCPGAAASCNPPSGSFFPLGLTTVSCTATDAAGNFSVSCSFTVRVDDNTGDVTSFEPCWRGQGGSTYQAWTFATSNNPAALLPNLQTNAFGAASGSLSFGLFSDGYIDLDLFLGCRQGIWDLGETGALTLTITNTTAGSGGSYKYVQVVATQFRDSLYNENATVSIAGGVLVSQAQEVVGTNSFGGEWVAAKSLWRLGSPCPASESVVLTAGTNGTLLDQVLVETMCMDVTCPLDIVASVDPGQCSKTNVSWTLPALDGCLVTNVVSTPPPGSTFPKGTNLVTVVVTDGEGGTRNCNFNVVILDDELPSVTCPADIVAVRTPSLCGAVVTFAASAADNCPGVTVGCIPPSGSVFPLGLTTVTCTATDAVGNVSAPCTFSVRVDDFSGDVAAFQPCWRGQAGSTFQTWTFGESNNPAALPPTLVTNTYGGVSASLNFGSFSDGYIESDPFLGCRQGIWDLGHTGMMTLSITNSSAGSGVSYKYVQVLVTQFRDSLYNENAAVAIAGGVLVGQAQQVVGTNNTGGEWIAAKTIWRLGPPCPADESILITAGTNGTLVDQVLVETLCIDLPCPPNILTSADPGQCSKSNVSFTLPAVDGCVVTNIVCSPTNGATFPVGTNLVTCTIMDGEGGTQVCNFTVTVLDITPPLVTATTAVQNQPGLGSIIVKDCANTTIQGTVNISITTDDACGTLIPTVTLTNGTASDVATYVDQSPAGTFNYTWAVTAGTSNGTWTVTAVATDASGNSTAAGFTLCVNKSQITGLVQLEGFTGTGPAVNHIRVVTFVATTNTTVLKTWTLSLTNVSGDTFSYSLSDVPAAINGLSAKAAWNLRERLAVTLDSNGQAVVDYLTDGTAGWADATDHYLRGGDITNENVINLADYTLLKNNFLTLFGPADMNGDGVVNLLDYNLMKSNYLTLGDPP